MQVAYLALYSRHNIKHCINPGPDPGQGRRNFPAPAKIVAPVVPYFMDMQSVFLAELDVNFLSNCYVTQMVYCSLGATSKFFQK